MYIFMPTIPINNKAKMEIRHTTIFFIDLDFM